MSKAAVTDHAEMVVWQASTMLLLLLCGLWESHSNCSSAVYMMSFSKTARPCLLQCGGVPARPDRAACWWVPRAPEVARAQGQETY